MADRRNAGENVDPVVQGHALTDLKSVSLLHPAQVDSCDRRLDGVGGLALAGMRDAEEQR
jgi:hypothetical protein